MAKRGLTGAFMVAGDFNSVISQDETLNYSAFSAQRSSDFVDWIQVEGLVDMGFSGSAFTWTKGASMGYSKAARLDRALCNIQWRQRFPDANVTHLPRVCSDHTPLLIRLKNAHSQRPPTTFKFQAAWLTSGELPGLVHDTWKTEESVQYNLPRMAAELSKWNRESFGNIIHRKNVVLSRLGGIQKKLSRVYCRGLAKLEKKLLAEYQDILYQEELMWFQRSREDWIVSGDRNTAYYHAAATIRRVRNTVSCLRDENGNWITDPALLKDHVRSYYVNLFSCEGGLADIRLEGVFPALQAVDWEAFNAAITKEKVHAALNDMAPFKSPGPDGFHAAFYQRMWDSVGDSMFKLVDNARRSSQLPEGLNKSLLVLIPKTKAIETIKQFRPISLCNVSYKVITKLITNRLKFILPKLVSPFRALLSPEGR